MRKRTKRRSFIAKVAKRTIDTLSDCHSSEILLLLHRILNHLSLDIVRLQAHDIDVQLLLTLDISTDSHAQIFDECFSSTVDEVAFDDELCSDARHRHNTRLLSLLKNG